jgi:hypothetical protein
LLKKSFGSPLVHPGTPSLARAKLRGGNLACLLTGFLLMASATVLAAVLPHAALTNV